METALVKIENHHYSKEYPPFPNDAVSGVAGRFATILGQYLESPSSFLFACFLTCLGTLISSVVTLASTIAPQPRLYTVILGQTADTRKSTAVRITLNFFKKMGLDVCYGAGSGEGLAIALEVSPNLLLCLDELKTLVNKMNTGANTLLPAINTLFETNNYSSVTKTKPIRVENAYLSLLTASTVDSFEKMFLPKFIEIGFLNRLFLVVGEGIKKHPIPPAIPEDDTAQILQEMEDLSNFIDALVSSGSGVYRMPIAPEAMQLFHDWYFTLPNTPFAKRLDTYAHRLMILLAVNDLKKTVDEDVMKKVVSLVNHQLEIRERLAPDDAFNQMAKLELLIRRKLKELGGCATKRQLQRKCNYNKYGISHYNNAIKHLEGNAELTYSEGQYHLLDQA